MSIMRKINPIRQLGHQKRLGMLVYLPIIALFCSLWLTGCDSSSNVLPNPISTTHFVSIEQFPTATTDISASKTKRATISPTHTSLPTTTPISSAIWTPQPTLRIEEAQKFVVDLVATNGNCQLPCWWGITPGESTWEETNHFLAAFATNIRVLQENLYGVTYDYLPDNISEGKVGATISVESGIVQTISTDVFYPLDQILREYGQPDEVRIFVDAQSIDALAPFVLALYYEQLGFLATFRGTAEKGSTSQICPTSIGENQTVWFLWSPQLEISFEKAGRRALLFVSPADRPFRVLEEATNISVQEFYETYRNPGAASVCFQWSDLTKP